MKETMHDCYLSQFKCMENLLSNRKEILKDFIDYYPVETDRIYLIGSGTSYNSCSAAAPFMEKILGVEVTPIAPSALGKLYGKKPFAIAVSQSGNSTNTIDAVNKLKEIGVPVVTLTDPKDSPVGNVGNLAVHLAADNEQIGPRTRGYTATVLTLYLMALEVGLKEKKIDEATYEKAITAYKSTFNNGEEYFKICQDFYDRHFGNLGKIRKYMFAGKDVLGRVAEESALKVIETVIYPAMGYDYEEFLHGPLCCAHEDLGVFIFLTHDEDLDRMLKSAELIGSITQNCYLISSDSSISGTKILVLPSDKPEYTSVFTNILFAQLISAKLTEDLDRIRHPGVKDIFDNMGTKAISKK